MNSHERRIVNRYWGHSINVYNALADECFPWLEENFGSCNFKSRRMPRWCWTPNMATNSNFTVYQDGVNFYFHKERDYVAFLLKWNR